MDSSGRSDQPISETTNLHSDLGLSSDEGLDFVLELCDEFDVEFPPDYNPVVHRDRRRGNNVAELAADVQRMLKAAEVSK